MLSTLARRGTHLALRQGRRHGIAASIGALNEKHTLVLIRRVTPVESIVVFVAMHSDLRQTPCLYGIHHGYRRQVWGRVCVCVCVCVTFQMSQESPSHRSMVAVKGLTALSAADVQTDMHLPDDNVFNAMLA